MYNGGTIFLLIDADGVLHLIIATLILEKIWYLTFLFCFSDTVGQQQFKEEII